MNKELYKKNIDTLTKNAELLRKWIEKQETLKNIQIFKSKNIYNFSIKHSSGINNAYDINNPLKMINEFVKNSEFENENATVILGLGAGHFVHKILKAKEKKHIIIVVEPIAQFLRLAFLIYDFTKWIKDGTVLFASPGKDEISYALGAVDTIKVITNYALVADAYINYMPNEYGQLYTFIANTINQMRCNVGTIMGAGSIIAENDIANLPYVIKHRGVGELTDLYKDKPAILVSTGPSLQKNIHLLMNKEKRENYIIIAVAQALVVLLAYDITPDFICTVDYGEVNAGHFKNLYDSDVPLVCLNRSYAPIIKRWEKTKFIVASPISGFEKTAAGVLYDKGYIDQGGSVAHLCLGLAKLLGCNPIAFIGQDLAISEKSHIAQVDESGSVGIDASGTLKWEIKDPKSILKDKDLSMGPPVKVPGYYGDIATTNVGLASFITAFENLINRYTDKTIIDATQGGAKIKGTILMSLRAYIKKYCKKKIENRKEKIQPLLSFADNGDELIEKVIPILKQDIKIIDKILFNASQGLVWAKQIMPNYHDKEKLKKILKENKKFSNKAWKLSKKNPLVETMIYKESREIQSRKLKAKHRVTYKTNNINDARIRIKRNKLILKAAVKAAVKLKKIYNESLEVLEKYNKTKDITLLQEKASYNFSFWDYEKYFKNGTFARPLVEARKWLNWSDSYLYSEAKKIYMVSEIIKKALNIRKNLIKKAKSEVNKNEDKILKYNELIIEAQRIGREENKFKKALSLLRKATKILPNRIEARWGLATALFHTKNFKESAKEYKKLSKDFPENKRFKFEYGQTLLYENVNEGIQVIIAVMKETDEFDSFLHRLGDLLVHIGKIKDAADTYVKYLEKFKSNYGVWVKLIDCYNKLGMEKESKKAQKNADKFKPVGELK